MSKDKDIPECAKTIENLNDNVGKLFDENISIKELLYILRNILTQKRREFIENHFQDQSPITLRNCLTLVEERQRQVIDETTAKNAKKIAKKLTKGQKPKLVKTNSDKKR